MPEGEPSAPAADAHVAHAASEAERRLQFIATASAELASSLDYERTLRTVAALAVPELADWCAVDLVTASGELQRLAVEHVDAARVAFVSQLQDRYPPRQDAPYGTYHVLRTGQLELMEEIPDELLAASAQDGEHLELLRRLGLRSYIVAPLQGRTRVLGTLTLVQAESGRRFHERDRPFFEDLARRAAGALENALLVRELQAAHDELQYQTTQLEDATAELELQATELEQQNEELQEHAEALDRLSADLDLAHREKLALLQSTTQGIYGIDARGRCTFINEAGAAMLGYSPEELLGRHMHSTVHHTRSDGRPYPHEECPIFKAFRTGEPVFMDDEALWRSDGTSFPAEYSSAPVRMGDETVGAVVWFQDIARRKSISARERLLGTVLERSLNEIYIFDAETLRFVQVNRGARENLGYTIEELRSLTPVDIKPEFTAEDFARLVAPLKSRETELVRFETVHQRRDGTLYPVEVHLQLSHAGETPLYVAVILDITQRRAAEAERQAAEEAVSRARDDAERANRAKSEFLAAMSHELRTPLNAIGGYLDLLDLGIHGDINDEQRQAISRIKRNQLYLLRLINDILRFARIEAGQLEFEMQPLQVDDLLRSVDSLMGPQAEARGLTYRCEVTGTDVAVNGDPERVQQILLNLIGNAIKFTDPGGTVELRAQPDGEHFLLHVSDTGRGIPADRIHAVFDPFVQLDRERHETSQQGVGLGLAISRDLARFMDGDILVTSEPGRGSTFTLRLRRA